ncbi:RNA polymerase sigma-70 factor, ECF subfamily [Pedobacter westerhofensis]|uniref:RNA polymerase sigma-70 factor, ECF subfamily n=1 Tax=Pedobacter westerhofensis TaxID=425512 RepID=A0A521EE98_9SPHI|nr:RNA polymerase sigma-70 factor [Pedobacter westerhofensis]SMO82247.1 RNA polymerase sigma-70 factor, ECF subfamily [Pedobacter westerhofensis]
MNSQHKAEYEPLSDTDLIVLLRHGDHAAFAEIYRRYYPLMLNFAVRKLYDEDLSKDFVQELFTNVWEKRETILESGNLRSYLYIFIRSRILNHFKNQNVQAKYIEVLKQAFSVAGYAQTDYLARERSLNEYIDRQIKSLPEKMRIVFQMSRTEHLSHKHIAQKLNTSEENVSKHITRALRSLKTKLTSWIF